jgi:hypothetical protein
MEFNMIALEFIVCALACAAVVYIMNPLELE